jgi:hypothetical protein
LNADLQADLHRHPAFRAQAVLHNKKSVKTNEGKHSFFDFTL